MRIKKLYFVIILILLLTPINEIFAQVPNVGFIPANIWYSQDPFQEGDKIKIYTLVYNPDDRELSTTVIFFDRTILLGKKDIKISPKSVKDVYIDWTVTSGEHIIFAKIENAKFLISKDKYEEVYLAENKTEESKRNVTKKAITNLPNNLINSISNSDSISNIQNLVKENTPVFVTKAIDSTVNALEEIRTDTNTSINKKKDEVKKEIEILEKTKINTEMEITSDGVKKNKTVGEKLKSTETRNNILKPFKYAELFFLNIFNFIFKQRIVFYGLLILIFLSILRYLWRRFF